MKLLISEILINFKMLEGIIPNKITKINKTLKIKNSTLFKSKKLIKYWDLILPKTTLLYNHKAYILDKIQPKVPKNAAVILFLKIPNNNKNSPTKLLVPGNAILAIVNAKKKNPNKGI